MGKIHTALHKASTPQQQTKQSQNEEVPKASAPSEPIEKKSSTPIFTKESTPKKSYDKRPHIPPLTAWNERIRLSIVPSSPIAESFRKLRTKILHPDQGQPPRTVLITSAVPGEGKGFTTANLGISIAQSAETTCTMIDCDLRRSSLATLFGLKAATKGLSNYLRDEIDWMDAVQLTAQKDLFLLPAGPTPDNPAELVDSSRTIEMMQELTTKTDQLFLFDSPPLHAAAETAVLAKMVDKVLIVVRWGKSGREQVKTLIDNIGREKIIGVVFNAFEQNALDSMFEKKGYYGYYGYYGKGY